MPHGGLLRRYGRAGRLPLCIAAATHLAHPLSAGARTSRSTPRTSRRCLPPTPTWWRIPMGCWAPCSRPREILGTSARSRSSSRRCTTLSPLTGRSLVSSRSVTPSSPRASMPTPPSCGSSCALREHPVSMMDRCPRRWRARQAKQHSAPLARWLLALVPCERQRRYARGARFSAGAVAWLEPDGRGRASCCRRNPAAEGSSPSPSRWRSRLARGGQRSLKSRQRRGLFGWATSVIVRVRHAASSGSSSSR
jgi:hypothetical protein